MAAPSTGANDDEQETTLAADCSRNGCNIELPQVLDCLTEPAIIVREDYRIIAANHAYRSLFAQGKKICGRYCYDVSHHYSTPCDEVGERCPVRLCQETGEPCRTLHVHHTPHGDEHIDVATHPIPLREGIAGSFLEIFRPTKVATTKPSESRLVGRSPAFNQTLELMARVAPTNTTVLLLGESGTGKELAAQAIHRMDDRRSAGSFVPVDCSGLSETLFESELFGHEKGAFTGAGARKPGLVEAADGGTLFLDEVGDIPLSLQVKLLRLLETGVFRRVGNPELKRADFRLICATHQNLRQMVERGTFRRDLYYRIGAFPIVLPPLRERVEDLKLLVECLGRRLGMDGFSLIHPDTMKALSSYSFPGNVRELLNILERARLLAGGGLIRPEHLPEEVLVAQAELAPAARTDDIIPLIDMETRYLRWAAATFRGERKQLAQRLGLSERSLYRKLHSVRKAAKI